VNYARRQQYRRLSHAGKAALGSALAALLGLAVASAGAAALGGLLLLTAVGLGLYARHWLSLARRSRVGARSEDEVQRALAHLQAEGWRLRHSLPWQGRGDIDSVAIAPSGVAVAIETKTRTYDVRHLARVHEQAVWLSRRRRRWCRHGVLAAAGALDARARWTPGRVSPSLAASALEQPHDRAEFEVRGAFRGAQRCRVVSASIATVSASISAVSSSAAISTP
jgi:hypothetical protein